MITLVRNKSDGKIHAYQNGTEIGAGSTDNTTSVPPYSDFMIGAQEGGSGSYSGYLNGREDEVSVFSTALSSSSILSLYNSGYGLSPQGSGIGLPAIH